MKKLNSWSDDPLSVERVSVQICINLMRHSSYSSFQITVPTIVPVFVTLSSFLFDDFKRQIFTLVVNLALQQLATIPINAALPPALGTTPKIRELIIIQVISFLCKYL